MRFGRRFGRRFCGRIRFDGGHLVHADFLCAASVRTIFSRTSASLARTASSSSTSRPAKMSQAMPSASIPSRSMIGWAFSVSTRRQARRSTGSGCRSTSPASSSRSTIRPAVIGSTSSRSASSTCFRRGSWPSQARARHCALVTPSAGRAPVEMAPHHPAGFGNFPGKLFHMHCI